MEIAQFELGVKMSFFTPFCLSRLKWRGGIGPNPMRSCKNRHQRAKNFSRQGLAHLVLEIFHLKPTLKKSGQNGIFSHLCTTSVPQCEVERRNLIKPFDYHRKQVSK